MAKLFSDLIPSDRLGQVTLAIEGAVARSFEKDQVKVRMTRGEVKRRFEICRQLILRLRGDLRWGLTRVLDHLPTYLRYELDGVKWEPDARTIWAPGDD